MREARQNRCEAGRKGHRKLQNGHQMETVESCVDHSLKADLRTYQAMIAQEVGCHHTLVCVGGGGGVCVCVCFPVGGWRA